MIRLSTSFLVTKATLLLAVCCVFSVVPVMASGVGQPNATLVAVDSTRLLNVQDWQKYENPRYGFIVRYPADLTLSTGEASFDVISGQVTTFIPTNLSDYSHTNLVNYSVLIGVKTGISPKAATEEMKNNTLYVGEIPTGQGNAINGLEFSRYYSAEGAAGHLYEKISCRVVVNGIRYEIAMVIHSLNLGAMSEGAVPFDAEKLGRLFETMVRTFRMIE